MDIKSKVLELVEEQRKANEELSIEDKEKNAKILVFDIIEAEKEEDVIKMVTTLIKIEALK